MTIINDSSRPRLPRGLGPGDLDRIRRFLQEAVNRWLADHGANEGFAARDLVAHANWAEPPLIALNNLYLDRGWSEPRAFDAASRGLGEILKDVLQRDTRNFESCRTWRTKEYRRVP